MSAHKHNTNTIFCIKQIKTAKFSTTGGKIAKGGALVSQAAASRFMPQKCKPQHFPRSKHIYFFTDFSRGFYSLNASHRPLPNSISLCLNTAGRQTKNKAPNLSKSTHTHAVSILYLGTSNTLCWLAELSLFGQKRGSEVRIGQYDNCMTVDNDDIVNMKWRSTNSKYL